MPYARSEAHLTELLENICENMNNYGEKVDPSTRRKNYVRVVSFDGTKMDLSETKFDGDVTSNLKFAVSDPEGKARLGKMSFLLDASNYDVSLFCRI